MAKVTTRRVRSTLLGGYTLLAPSLFGGVVCFLLLPMLVVLWLSLHRWDLLGPPIRYVGLDNWRSVLTDAGFGNSLLVTLAFIAIVVPVQILLGVVCRGIAVPRIAGQRRVPHRVRGAVGVLAAGGRGAVALDPGADRRAVSTVLGGRRVEWLTDPGLALPVVSAVTVWMNVAT